MELVAAAPAVVCCRCSPEQKAAVVRLIERHSGRRAAAIGDGGNDVSMIQVNLTNPHPRIAIWGAILRVGNSE